jgi:hypothetical protein
MSTKINVRSPFYLNITEPVKPLPLFTCGIANILNLSIDQQGQINTPILSYGIIDSITSSDAGFSNGKFATVSTATDRNITVRVLIPEGFSNSSDVYIDCANIVTQPALITSQPTPSDPPVSCTGGPTTSGSIPSQTLDVDGDSDTIDLTSYFTQGSEAIAGYTIYNPSAVVNASVNGDTLTLSSNAIGGTTTVYVSAYDNASNSCTATQGVSVTVNAPDQDYACVNNGINALGGGSIAQDGTITNPNSTAASINFISETEGGSPITSYSANNTGSDRSVTLWFNLTAPAGYGNAGSNINCSRTFNQPAGLPTFDCELANLNGQQISTKGIINPGSASLGTISDWTPKTFAEVTTATPRTVTFTVDVPSGYSNSGTISCPKTITQPASLPTCGDIPLYISQGSYAPRTFCTATYPLSTPITSTVNQYSLGGQVCRNGSAFNGQNLYYAVATSPVTVGPNYGNFIIWQIDSNGIIQDVRESVCKGTESSNVQF